MRSKRRLPVILRARCVKLILSSEEDALFSDAKSQLQELKEAVVKYQQKTGLTPPGVAQLDTAACTWSEIQELTEVATSGLGSDDESDKIKLSCSKISKEYSRIRQLAESFARRRLWCCHLRCIQDGRFGKRQLNSSPS